MGVRRFALPDLGEGLEEAELVEWHVAPGDRVVADQPLASVETDKAVVEVPAPWAGTVTRLLAEPGETVAVGAPIAEFETAPRADAGAVVGRLAETPDREPGSETAPAPQRTQDAPSGAGKQRQPEAGAPRGQRQAKEPPLDAEPHRGPEAEPEPEARRAAEAEPEAEHAGEAGPEPQAGSGRHAVPGRPGGATPIPRAMPAARALARQRGLDLAGVAATGPDGAITRADVLRACAGDDAGGRSPDALPDGWRPLRGARRAMARRMAEAGAAVVPATLHDEADVTAWMAPEADVLVRLVRAAAAGVAAEPALNAWFDGARAARRRGDRLDLGIAVDTPEGLYVPVLRGADGLDAAACRREADRLIAAARERRLRPEDSANATLTLSSYGALGGRHAVLVVSPPQVAILGAGRAFASVAWGAQGPERRLALPLSLSFDHRAVTGGEAARFLAALRADLERPA